MLAASLSQAATIKINFEGIQAHAADAGFASVGEYYNGGRASNNALGVDYGVSFSSALAICLNTAGVNCTEASKGEVCEAGSGFTAMTASGSPMFMNVAAGFETTLSFFYTNPTWARNSVELWSGLNGTGTLLKTLVLAGTADGSSTSACLGAGYCPFEKISISFDGIAKSFVLAGEWDQIAIDDIEFQTAGSSDPSQVPEPATLSLVAVAALPFHRHPSLAL
ncbi:hypothetical protein [Bryobacter aggregatus]|uniref:hypothetical protein n=1 Tax=Bryobacter aggregatus TaxID=360054 RepID=UPI0004E0CFDF|nr:hypothetical protein [Bryobacter aggregatus]